MAELPVGAIAPRAAVGGICRIGPRVDNDELRKLVDVQHHPETPDFRSAIIPCLYPVAKGAEGLHAALDEIRQRASMEIAAGAQILILSDKGSSASSRRSRRCCRRARCITT